MFNANAIKKHTSIKLKSLVEASKEQEEADLIQLMAFEQNLDDINSNQQHCITQESKYEILSPGSINRFGVQTTNRTTNSLMQFVDEQTTLKDNQTNISQEQINPNEKGWVQRGPKLVSLTQLGPELQYKMPAHSKKLLDNLSQAWQESSTFSKENTRQIIGQQQSDTLLVAILDQPPKQPSLEENKFQAQSQKHANQQEFVTQIVGISGDPNKLTNQKQQSPQQIKPTKVTAIQQYQLALVNEPQPRPILSHEFIDHHQRNSQQRTHTSYKAKLTQHGKKVERMLLRNGLSTEQVINLKKAVKEQVRSNALVTRTQKRIIEGKEFMLPTFKSQFVPIIPSHNKGHSADQTMARSYALRTPPVVNDSFQRQSELSSSMAAPMTAKESNVSKLAQDVRLSSDDHFSYLEARSLSDYNNSQLLNKHNKEDPLNVDQFNYDQKPAKEIFFVKSRNVSPYITKDGAYTPDGVNCSGGLIVSNMKSNHQNDTLGTQSSYNEQTERMRPVVSQDNQNRKKVKIVERKKSTHKSNTNDIQAEIKMRKENHQKLLSSLDKRFNQSQVTANDLDINTQNTFTGLVRPQIVSNFIHQEKKFPELSTTNYQLAKNARSKFGSARASLELGTHYNYNPPFMHGDSVQAQDQILSHLDCTAQIVPPSTSDNFNQFIQQHIPFALLPKTRNNALRQSVDQKAYSKSDLPAQIAGDRISNLAYMSAKCGSKMRQPILSQNRKALDELLEKNLNLTRTHNQQKGSRSQCKPPSLEHESSYNQLKLIERAVNETRQRQRQRQKTHQIAQTSTVKSIPEEKRHMRLSMPENMGCKLRALTDMEERPQNLTDSEQKLKVRAQNRAFVENHDHSKPFYHKKRKAKLNSVNAASMLGSVGEALNLVINSSSPFNNKNRENFHFPINGQQGRFHLQRNPHLSKTLKSAAKHQQSLNSRYKDDRKPKGVGLMDVRSSSSGVVPEHLMGPMIILSTNQF